MADKEYLRRSKQLSEVTERFLEAMKLTDADAMAQLWIDSPISVCVHPCAPFIFDKKKIALSWRRVFDGLHNPQFEVEVSRLSISESTGFAALLFKLSDRRFTVLNVYQWSGQGRGWKLIAHVAGVIKKNRTVALN